MNRSTEHFTPYRNSKPPFSRHVRKALSERRDCKGKGRPWCLSTTMTVNGWCVRCKQKFGFDRAQEERAAREAARKTI